MNAVRIAVCNTVTSIVLSICCLCLIVNFICLILFVIGCLCVLVVCL